VIGVSLTDEATAHSAKAEPAMAREILSSPCG
jgi:hypothetical protein